MRHFTHRWPQLGHFFPKLGHFFPIFEKGQSRPRNSLLKTEPHSEPFQLSTI